MPHFIMGTIISLASFVWRCLRATIGFLVSIPGTIVSSIVGLYAAFESLCKVITDPATKMYELITKAQEHVEAFTEFIKGQTYWGFFYELFALETFMQVFTAFTVLALALLVLVAFDFFFHGVVIAVPFFIYKSVGKIIQAVSGGLAKPV